MNKGFIPDIYAEMNLRVVPYAVEIEVTALCNVDCRHCYHVRCDGPEMTAGEIMRLMDDLAALGTFELTISGGEPLLRPDLTGILEHAVNTAGFSVKLFSNLTLLDERTADVLARLPLNMVETTLLGATNTVHDAVTGCTGSFDATISGIRMLRDRGVRVGAKTVVMRGNENDIDSMYALAADLAIPFRHDDCLFPESGGGRSPFGLQIADDEIRRIRRRYEGTESNGPAGVCNAARSVMHIGPDGLVYPCGAFPSAAGSARERPVGEIWRDSPLFKRVRALTMDDYAVCAGCRYFLRCRGCVAMGMGIAKGRLYPCAIARKRFRDIS